MARTDNLTNFLTDVSSAIKTKKGDNTPIKASNFDTEIANLPTGSGGADLDDYFYGSGTGGTGSSSAGYWTKLVKNLKPLTGLPAQCAYYFYMYQGEEIDLSQVPLNTTITHCMNMFASTKCKKIDVSRLNFDGVASTANMFSSNEADEIILGNNRFPASTTFYRLFHESKQAIDLPIENLDYSNVTTMEYFMGNSSKVVKEQIDIYAPVCKNFYYAFYNCDKVKNIKLKSDVPVTSMGYCFGSSENLVSVDIEGLDLSGLTGTSASTGITNLVTSCSNLQTLKFGTNYGAGFSSTLSANSTGAGLELHYCTKLTKESVIDLFNKLADISSKNTQRIVLPSSIKNQLTDVEKAIATNKGWTLA